MRDATDDIETYKEREFPEFRDPILDTLELGIKKHHIPFLFEVDVPKAREYMREFKSRTGEGLSFAAHPPDYVWVRADGSHHADGAAGPLGGDRSTVLWEHG